MASIQYLRLDANLDPIWNAAFALTDVDAVAQAIQTRLGLFAGEWWENISQGLPLFQSIIGAPASAKNQAVIRSVVTQTISQTPYVSGVSAISMSFDPTSRALTFSAIAQTAFGSIPVSMNPGSLYGGAG